MSYSRLFIWVEGKDDTRFFETVITPLLTSRFDFVKILPYCEWKKDKVSAFITSIASMNAEYLIVGDLDDRQGIEQAKFALLKRFGKADIERIVITVQEIESWYIAGLPESWVDKYRLKVPNPTHGVSKEDFDALKPNTFLSRIDWMVEILANFSIEQARLRNESFRYLLEKLQITV